MVVILTPGILWTTLNIPIFLGERRETTGNKKIKMKWNKTILLSDEKCNLLTPAQQGRMSTLDEKSFAHFLESSNHIGSYADDKKLNIFSRAVIFWKIRRLDIIFE